MTTEQRFGPRFVAEQQRRYGKRPPENRMLSYDLAVLEEYQPWRIWLDEQLNLLPEPAADAFAANLWRDQNFWPDVTELAAGAALRRLGFGVELERQWGRLTPDWTVIGEGGEPVALVEVLSHRQQGATLGLILNASCSSTRGTWTPRSTNCARTASMSATRPWPACRRSCGTTSTCSAGTPFSSLTCRASFDRCAIRRRRRRVRAG
ncbi:hypothetical protein EES41_39565 (plasmid) [Streptomyces sp. ADI95-16]|nr:hypothetical protein EES41_39565 [Streptomyces sp. ADI95-16]